MRFAVDSICKGAPLSDQVKALKTNREVIDFVSKTPDAIGIIGVNWLSDRNDSTGLSFSKEVRVMSVSAADKAERASVGICLLPCFRPGTADYFKVGISTRYPTGTGGEYKR